MSSRRATFECQVLQSKNWTVINLYDDEASAIRAAEQELKARRAEGVRVIRNWQRADGELAEKVVFEKQGDAKPLRDVRITPIETANACADEADFLSPESLATMGRLFRKYLDERRITPTEVLHLPREYQRIWDTESIVPAGVDRVAVVQTRGTERDSRSRAEEIYRAVEAIGARARRCEARRGLPNGWTPPSARFCKRRTRSPRTRSTAPSPPRRFLPAISSNAASGWASWTAWAN